MTLIGSAIPISNLLSKVIFKLTMSRRSIPCQENRESQTTRRTSFYNTKFKSLFYFIKKKNPIDKNNLKMSKRPQFGFISELR